MKSLSRYGGGQKLTFRLRLLTSEGENGELLSGYRALTGPIRGTVGCSGCHLYQEAGEPGEIVLVSDWRSEGDFVTHVRSELFRQILQLAESASEAPEVEVRASSVVRGMGYLETILEDRPEGRQ